MKNQVKFLSDLTSIAFDILLSNYENYFDKIKSFTLLWLRDEDVSVRCFTLTGSDYENPTFALLSFKSGESKLVLLKNPPIFKSSIIYDEDLEIYSTLEVGKSESEIFENKGRKEGRNITLYLEFHSGYQGIEDITDPKNRLCCSYSSDLKKLGINLYWNSKYNWYKEYFETLDGSVIPVS